MICELLDDILYTRNREEKTELIAIVTRHRTAAKIEEKKDGKKECTPEVPFKL